MIHQLDTVPGRTCLINGKTYLFFSGYDYLGMQSHPEFIEIIKEGFGKYGWLHPSSRISNTRLHIYEACEQLLSSKTSTENSLLLSSGFLAGQALHKILSVYKDIYYAPRLHPALNPNPTAAVPGFSKWSQETLDIINSNISAEPKIICFDAVDIFKPEINDVSFLTNIKADQKLIVVIDDSHGIGITGEIGKGASSYIHMQSNIEYVFVYSLSKAFNIIGGAVSGPKHIIDLLKHSPAYAASTAPAPGMLHAFLHGQNIYTAQLKKLKDNINYFTNSAKGLSLSSDLNLPIVILNNINTDKELYDYEIIISSFNYPLSSSLKINRIVLNAGHTIEDIHQLISVLA
ncbi:MAG: aminotransferase class I/II-fold pyridoxal phosphate-dependent enzyme [Ginsengibacter sp.]